MSDNLRPERRFGLAVAGLSLLFIVPLWHLIRFALGDDLHSHAVLMPFVSLYLARVDKPDLTQPSAPAFGAACGFALLGGLALAGHWFWPDGALTLTVLAWVAWVTAAGCWTLGGRLMCSLVFPFALLLFMIPLPPGLRLMVETALQHGSAVVADWMFTLVGTPVYCTGTTFRLPGMSLEVAPECSGIHSTLVLFITSLVVSRLFLQSPWRRTVLVLVVIPLALLRNGFRILVIGELCVHVGPQMIDSVIHHRGGPLFFVLSLVPFFLLLYWLRKTERPGNGPRSSAEGNKP